MDSSSCLQGVCREDAVGAVGEVPAPLPPLSISFRLLGADHPVHIEGVLHLRLRSLLPGPLLLVDLATRRCLAGGDRLNLWGRTLTIERAPVELGLLFGEVEVGELLGVPLATGLRLPGPELHWPSPFADIPAIPRRRPCLAKDLAAVGAVVADRGVNKAGPKFLRIVLEEALHADVEVISGALLPKLFLQLHCTTKADREEGGAVVWPRVRPPLLIPFPAHPNPIAMVASVSRRHEPNELLDEGRRVLELLGRRLRRAQWPSLHLVLLDLLALSPGQLVLAERKGDGPPVLAQRRLVALRWRGLHTGAAFVGSTGRRPHEQSLTSAPLLFEELSLREAVLPCQAPVGLAVGFWVHINMGSQGLAYYIAFLVIEYSYLLDTLCTTRARVQEYSYQVSSRTLKDAKSLHKIP